MEKTNINPAILQEMLASATNAAEKGQSQFFTPLDFGRWCARALPETRPVIVDLNCGNAQLLQASARLSPPAPPKSDRTYYQWEREKEHCTHTLLGSDIDPTRSAKGVQWNKITYDVTLLQSLLDEVNWTADLFVLNPPWRLHWHRDRLKNLEESRCQAVRDAWKAEEEGAPHGTIDSTIATLMIALDRCSRYGEGFLIANNNTLDRLLFNPGAPFKALAQHIWTRVVVPGNPMTGLDHCKWHDKSPLPAGEGKGEGENQQPSTSHEQQFCTGVIYFARDHTAGPVHVNYPELPDRANRMGAEVTTSYYCTEDTANLWNTVREQVNEITGREKPVFKWNVWLGADGRILTHLSTFTEKSAKTDKREADRLFKLTGQSPMELVIQRNTRDDVVHVIEHSKWKIDPVLIEAVKSAIQEYHASRAPLYPLSEIQRLGYLDEQNNIQCKADLMLKIPIESPGGGTNEKIAPAFKPGYMHCDNHLDAEGASKASISGKKPSTINYQLSTIFRAGQSYSIRTQTVQVTRTKRKPNAFTGDVEKIELTGQELAIFIADRVRDPGDEETEFQEYCFMDGSLRTQDTKVSEARQQKGRRRSWQPDAEAIPIDFTLQELAAHFIIPEVPDVATNNPDQYRANLATLEQIEQLCLV